MKTKHQLNTRKIKCNNCITALLTAITLGSLFALFLLPVSWGLMWTMNSLFIAFESTFELNFWIIYFCASFLLSTILIISLVRSGITKTNKGKLLQHDDDMRYIEDITGSNYDYYTDPYDF